VGVLPTNAAPPSAVVDPVVRPDPLADFSRLEDVTASVQAGYGLTSFDEANHVLYADLAARNAGTYEIQGPLLVTVRNLSDPAVRLRDNDGVTPDGLPYYILHDAPLNPTETTAPRRVAFFNPGGQPFTYDLVFSGALNRTPTITTNPDVEALAGKPYEYTAAATDPEHDPLTFTLLQGPANLALDPATGQITWAPTASEVGNHAVAVQVEDGHGGVDEQLFTLAVRDGVPNRPPVILSPPPVDGTVLGAYDYLPSVLD